MAERAFETPNHFFEHVVQPNEDAFRENPNSLHSAFNAVMSTDAFAGHIYLLQKSKNLTTAHDDSAFRAELAAIDNHFLIIRDTAKALKHVELTRSSPVITRADQAVVAQKGFGMGVYSVGKFSGEEVMLRYEDGTEKHCLSEVLLSNQFLRNFII